MDHQMMLDLSLQHGYSPPDYQWILILEPVFYTHTGFAIVWQKQADRKIFDK